MPALGSTDPAGSLEMVSVAHRDLAKVRALAARHPGLVRAAIDGGFGDWESALGAASHVGNRAIAEFLLANGETPTILSAAMLGQLDLVKSFLTASPSLEHAYTAPTASPSCPTPAPVAPPPSPSFNNSPASATRTFRGITAS